MLYKEYKYKNVRAFNESYMAYLYIIPLDLVYELWENCKRYAVSLDELKRKSPPVTRH